MGVWTKTHMLTKTIHIIPILPNGRQGRMNLRTDNKLVINCN